MNEVPLTNEVGFAAAGLVLATFCMRSMSALRCVAIASNLAFIGYGYLGGLAPILLLHALLLPVNIYRLAQLGRPRLRSEPIREGKEHGCGSGRPFRRFQEILNHRGGRPRQTGGSHA
jgi:hypothetical protein